MNLWLVLIAIALIVVSGLLIAAETAMTRVSKTRIDELRKEGNGNEKRAELLLGVLQDRARYVNVLFLLSTIATITSITLISYVAVRALTSGDGWSVIEIDAVSLETNRVGGMGSDASLQGASSALQVDNNIWVGTYSGDRIGYFERN